MYGITETTVHVTYRPITMKDVLEGRPSLIGRPLPDLQVYILDPRLQPVPIGVPGEIHVAGKGLARGYLGRGALSAQRFIPDPFGRVPGARMYRSGDLGRYLADGDIEYLGRIDGQIKIRGHRIELAEVESILAQHHDVREALAIVREDQPGEKSLVAYLVSVSGKPIETDRILHFLREKLPGYMLPSAMVFLAALPLTPNGKVDRKALPAPEGARPLLQHEYAAPATATEKLLAGIWGEVLGVERVGTEDSFFDLGGHSLLAVQGVARVREVFGVDVPVRALFEQPTIANLAKVIDAILWARTVRADMDASPQLAPESEEEEEEDEI